MPGTTPRGSVHVYPLVHQTTKTGQLRGGLKPLVAAGNAGIIEGPPLFVAYYSKSRASQLSLTWAFRSHTYLGRT